MATGGSRVLIGGIASVLPYIHVGTTGVKLAMYRRLLAGGSTNDLQSHSVAMSLTYWLAVNVLKNEKSTNLN